MFHMKQPKKRRQNRMNEEILSVFCQNDDAKTVLKKSLKEYFPRFADSIYKKICKKYADYRFPWNMKSVGLVKWSIVVESACERYSQLEKLYDRYNSISADTRKTSKQTTTDKSRTIRTTENETTVNQTEKYNPVATQNSKISGIVEGKNGGKQTETTVSGGEGFEVTVENEENGTDFATEKEFLGMMQNFKSPIYLFINLFQSILIPPEETIPYYF